MHCRQCSRSIPENVDMCPHCGISLVFSESSVAKLPSVNVHCFGAWALSVFAFFALSWLGLRFVVFPIVEAVIPADFSEEFSDFIGGSVTLVFFSVLSFLVFRWAVRSLIVPQVIKQVGESSVSNEPV